MNANLAWNSADARYQLALWGRNLADRTFARSGIRLDGQIGNLRFWGAPRTYGFTVAARY